MKNIGDKTVAADAGYFRVLLDYNRWANHLVMDRARMDRAREVAEADYHAIGEGLSFGSLHATLVHILLGELIWLARWEGSLPPERLKNARKADQLAETEIPTFEALTELWRREEDRMRRFSSALTDEAVSTTVAYDDQHGNPHKQPLSQLIAHLINHGTQFRAEAAVRLTQLELSPGDLDLIIFLWHHGCRGTHRRVEARHADSPMAEPIPFLPS